MNESGSFRNAVKNTGLLSVGLFLGRILAFFVFRRLAHLEGPAGLGIWGVAVELTAIFVIAANFGLGTLVTREIIKEPGATGSLFWSSLRIRWLAGAAGYLLLVGFVLVAGYDSLTRWAVLVMALGVFLEASALGCDAVLQAKGNFRGQAVSQVLSAIVYFALSFYWLDRGAGLAGVIWANVISRGIRLALVGGMVAPWLRPRSSDTRAPGLGTVDLARMAWPIFLATTLGVLAFKVDTLLVMQFLGEEGAGIYTAGRRPVDLLVVIPNLFAVAIFPALQRLYETAAVPRGMLRDWASRALLLLTVAVLPPTLFCLVSAEPVVRILTGHDSFAQSTGVLRWAVLGLPLMAYLSVANRLLLVVGRERKFVRVSLIILAVVAGLGLALIPWIGPAGAALGLVGGLLVGCFLYRRELIRVDLAPTCGLRVGAGILSLLLAWAAAVPILQRLRPDWRVGWFDAPLANLSQFVVIWGITGVLYVVLLVLFRVVVRNDLTTWRSVPEADRIDH